MYLSWNITGNRGRRYAARHFIWQATLTYFFGAKAAKRIGDAHEWGEKCTPRHCDTGRDQHNNQVARIFESSSWNHRQTRYWLNRGLLFQYLYNVGNWLYFHGYLHVLPADRAPFPIIDSDTLHSLDALIGLDALYSRLGPLLNAPAADPGNPQDEHPAHILQALREHRSNTLVNG